MILGFTVIFILYFALQFYLAKRLAGGIGALFSLDGKRILIPFAVLSFGVPLSFLVSGDGTLAAAVEYWGGAWMGVTVYLFLFTLAAEIVLLILRLAKPRRVHLFRGITSVAVCVLTLAVCTAGLIGGARVEKVQYDLSSGKDAVKIALASDIHLGAAGSFERFSETVERINETDADLVCLAGDIFNDSFASVPRKDEVKRLFLSLKSRYGVYAVLGNHDSGESLSEMCAFLEESGVRLLRDEAVTVADKFVLAGRLDLHPIGETEGWKRGPLEDFLPETALPVVVMDHNPREAASYGEGISLVLSGHTHKGQIFPGSLITGGMYTVDYGVYQRDASSPFVVVSSGAGLWGPPMRVGTQNEVVEILFSPQ